MSVHLVTTDLAEGGSTRIGYYSLSPTRPPHEFTTLLVNNFGYPASQGRLTHHGNAIDREKTQGHINFVKQYSILYFVKFQYFSTLCSSTADIIII